MFQEIQFLRNYLLRYSIISYVFSVSTGEAEAGGSLGHQASQGYIMRPYLKMGKKKKQKGKKGVSLGLLEKRPGKEVKAYRHMAVPQQNFLRD